jgi:hypothetical protein
MAKIIAWGLVLMALCSCESPTQEVVTERIEKLASSQRIKRCELANLQKQATALWDSIALELDRNLPTDMPADERYNMIQVRNTALLQMFMVFDSLAMPLQEMVEAAGTKDSLLAVAMKTNHAEYQAVSNQLDSFLMVLEQHFPARYQEVALHVLALEKEDCR